MRFSTSPLIVTVLGSTTVWAQNGPLPEYGIGDHGNGVAYDPSLLLGATDFDQGVWSADHGTAPTGGEVDYGALGGGYDAGVSHGNDGIPYVDLNRAGQGGYAPVTDPAPIDYGAGYDPAPAYGTGATDSVVYGDASSTAYGETYGGGDAYEAAPDLYAPAPIDYGTTAGYAPDPAYDPAPTYSPAPSYDPAPGYDPAPAYDPAPSYQPVQTYEPAPSYDPAPSYQPAPAYASGGHASGGYTSGGHGSVGYASGGVGALAYNPYAVDAASASHGGSAGYSTATLGYGGGHGGYSGGDVFVDANAMASLNTTTMHGMGVAPPVILDHGAASYAAAIQATAPLPYTYVDTSAGYASAPVAYDPAPTYAPLPAPAPVYDPAPVYTPIPTPAPVYSGGVSYDSAPVYTSDPVYTPAPVYAGTVSYEPAPVYAPAPVYTPAPGHDSVYEPQAYQPVVHDGGHHGQQHHGGHGQHYGGVSSTTYVQIHGGGVFGQDLDGDGVSFDTDDGWTAGIVGGVETTFPGIGARDKVRYGVEYQHTSSDLGGINVNGFRSGYDHSLDIDAVYLRAEYAPDLGGPVRPYVGAGIGYGVVDIGNGLGTESGVFAKGIAGIEVELAPDVDVFAEYNYVVGPELSYTGGAASPFIGTADLDYTGHQVMGGIRFTF